MKMTLKSNGFGAIGWRGQHNESLLDADGVSTPQEW